VTLPASKQDRDFVAITSRYS